MVAMSELAFRMVVRRYGVGLCYTQMAHAKNFANVAIYRKETFDGLEDPLDRPLVAQFAGNDPETLVRAAQFVEHQVDAVDGELFVQWIKSNRREG